MKTGITPLAISVLLALQLSGLSAEEVTPESAAAQEQARENSDIIGKQAEPARIRVFSFDIGISGGYSTGMSVSNFYYRPFANLYLRNRYVKFTAGISRYQNLLITNGYGIFERVNVTQPKLALSLYPLEVIELYGEYRFSCGDPSHYYRGHEGTAGFLLDFDPVTIDASINIRNIVYRFKTFDWQSAFTLLFSSISHSGHVTSYYLINTNDLKYLDDISAAVTCSWFVIDTTSIDATYYYMNSVFRYPKDSYNVHTGRIGVYSDVWKYISLYGGISLGIDSEQYLIASGDLGISFNILEHASLSFTYMPGYYKSRETVSSLDRFVNIYALYFIDYNIMGSENPYLKSSLIGKSFMNHSFTFSAAYKY
ncbi:MAG: hypothetical protein JXA07_15030 [Spirochaetes bacterium]|nr:hypothetical protein [Spirochaetota bacterium]